MILRRSWRGRSRCRAGETSRSQDERIIGSSAANVWITSSSSMRRHLRGVLSSYFHYYHKTRTHLSLDKDCPGEPSDTPTAAGKIVPFPRSVVCIIATNGSLLMSCGDVQDVRLQRGTCSALQVRHSNVLAPKARPRAGSRPATVALLTCTRDCHYRRWSPDPEPNTFLSNDR